MKTNDTNIKILYEDENVLVLDKPAGLMVHGDGKASEPTLADWLVEKYPIIKDVGEPLRIPHDELNSQSEIRDESILRPGIVHRLDKDTSGVMIVAKNQNAYEFLKKQFQGRTIEKVYRALVYGNVKDDSGEIMLPIGKSRSDPRLWSASKNARGTLRDARTIFKVLKRFGEVTYIEVYPKTGRTHQIRVHMKAIFHPVVGDPLYAPGKPTVSGISRQARLHRQALHALSLELVLPSGERKKFEAPLPDDFQSALEYLESS